MFDLDAVVSILISEGFSEIVLQFTEENLHQSIEVYFYIQDKLFSHFSTAFNLYISANTSFNGLSAADDITAKHISAAQVIVYFGSELSVAKNTIPVIIVPEMKLLEYKTLLSKITLSLQTKFGNGDLGNIVLMYDISYYWATLRLYFDLLEPNECVKIAKRPFYADLECWSKQPTTANSSQIIGGLRIEESINERDVIVYIGGQTQQLQNIMFRYSKNCILHYDPSLEEARSIKGESEVTLKERYGGIHAVKEAKIIGLILSAIAIEKNILNQASRRLQRLIKAAKKNFYVFVMGRISENKLCNFPEIDVYCLLGNEDMNSFRPKLYPVPIITAFELEIGLGVREWTASLSNKLEDLFDVDEKLAVWKVKENFQELWEEEDADEESAEENTQALILSALNSDTHDNQLVVFSSAAADYFSSRTFTGLEESRQQSTNDSQDLVIQPGKFGIASKYTSLGSNVVEVKDLEDL